jgi:hypothetical protein
LGVGIDQWTNPWIKPIWDDIFMWTLGKGDGPTGKSNACSCDDPGYADYPKCSSFKYSGWMDVATDFYGMSGPLGIENIKPKTIYDGKICPKGGTHYNIYTTDVNKVHPALLPSHFRGTAVCCKCCMEDPVTRKPTILRRCNGVKKHL